MERHSLPTTFTGNILFDPLNILVRWEENILLSYFFYRFKQLKVDQGYKAM